MTAEQDTGGWPLVVRSVDSLVRVHGLKRVRKDNRRTDGPLAGADWLWVAEVSVQAVRSKSKWRLDAWCELAARSFTRSKDEYAFGYLIAGVPIAVSEEEWFEGRHRAVHQIDAGATEIVTLSPDYLPFDD
jgi:hypothetical protein